jgi:arylsulfatase A-like enzyme
LYDGVSELHREGEYATDLFADACSDFIRRQSHSGKPWFAYLPFNAPHFPSPGNKRPGEPNVWQAPDWAFEPYGWTADEQDPHRRYCAVVFALDRAIGRVLDTLEDAGVAEQTMVFFMSDNGAFRLNRAGLDVGSNHPLRSGGITCWEGGIRVPAIARWPGRIEAGVVIDQPCWSPDLLVTAAALAEAPLPPDVRFDGHNIIPLLTEQAPSPHESFFFSFRSHSALRQGDWKIVRERPDQPWQLFHLGNDVAESNNLAAQHPQRVAELTARFDDWIASFP